MEYLRKAFELMQSKRAILTASISFAVLLLSLALSLLGLKLFLFIILLISLILGFGYLLYCYIQTGQNPKQLDRFNHYLTERARQLKQMGLKRFAMKPSPFAHLPWFILMGATDSGKTSLLRHSGIHFPALESKDSVDSSELKEIEEQAHCDWWFANQAVFIDTAGWYMRSGPASKHWQMLLKRIKGLKRQQPLNGIILTIDFRQLQQKNVDLNVEQLRARVEHLYQALGYLIPVSLVVTHCDAMPGFDAFFSSLDTTSKAQAWGMQFSDKGALNEELSSSMDGLYSRLNARLFHQLSLEKDKQQKLAQIRFPQQFIRLKPYLMALLDVLAKDNIYQEKLNLTGLYFTSAKESEKGYFIHDLLQNQWIQTKQQAAYSLNKQKELKQKYYGLWTALALGFVLSLWALLTSFTYNNALLKEGDLLVKSMLEESKMPQNSQEKLAFLNAAGKHFLKLSEFKTREPWYHKLGMSRVNSQKAMYQQFLAKALERDFYQQVNLELVKELQAYHKRWQLVSNGEREALRGDYYADLKAYLMLHFPIYMDVSFASQHLAEKWQKRWRSEDSNEAISNPSLIRLSRFYLEYLSGLEKEKRAGLGQYQTQVIHDARRDLMTRSGVSNVYAQLSLQLRKQGGTLSLDQFFDDAAVADLWQADSQIPRFFSREGYVRDVKPVFSKLAKSDLRHDWVIHGQLERLAKSALLSKIIKSEQEKKTMDDLNAFYFQQYLDAWLQFVSSVKVLHFNSVDDASQQLRALYQSEGAYRHLFNQLHANFALAEFLDKETERVLPEHLRQRFKELEGLTANAKKSNALLEQYHKQLMLLQQDIERLSIGSELALGAEQYVSALLMGKGKETEIYKSSLLVDQLLNQLNGLSSRQAFKLLLLSPVQESYRALLLESVQGLQAEWQKSIYQLYQERLAQRFPFNPRGQDAHLADVVDFYKPRNGLLATFINERIDPYLKQQGKGFVLRSWLGVKPPFNEAFLNYLARETALSQALFPNDNHELNVRFMIYPSPTPGLKEILFVSNGQSYPYRNGPQEWVNFTWPGQDRMENESFIRVTQSFADAQSAKEFQGVWGLFHLLHSASRVIKMDRGYKLQWHFSHAANKSVQLILAAKTSSNPFEALLFNPQPIPERLLD